MGGGTMSDKTVLVSRKVSQRTHESNVAVDPEHLELTFKPNCIHNMHTQNKKINTASL